MEIRDDLKAAGCESVFLDVSALSGDMTAAMRKHLAESDRVIVICTPVYSKRIQLSSSNVGYEFEKTCEKRAADPGCVYPLWLAGEFASAVPEVFRSETVYDCRDAFRHTIQLLVKKFIRSFIFCIHLKNIFCQINANYANIMHNSLSYGK